MIVKKNLKSNQLIKKLCTYYSHTFFLLLTSFYCLNMHQLGLLFKTFFMYIL